MLTFAAVVALVLGALCGVVAVIGIRDGSFPFRPRNSGTAPDGDRHTLQRTDEPVLFWVAAVGLLCVGALMLVMAGGLALRLFRGES